MIYGGVATYPPRLQCLRESIRSMSHCIDVLFVYLNNIDEVPEWLIDQKIVIIRGCDAAGDIKGSGKFYMSDKVVGLYLAFDDDIIYPEDYVERLSGMVSSMSGKCLAGVHGAILRDNPKGILDMSWGCGWANGLDKDREVHVLGAGTVCFDTNKMRIDVRSLPANNMDDLFVSAEAAKHNFPCIAIHRREAWLKSNTLAANTPSVFESIQTDSSKIDEFVKRVQWKVLK